MRMTFALAVLLTLSGVLGAADLSNPRKHLVLDPRLIDKTENLRLVPGTVEKDPRNPLFQADKSWENALNNLYPNIIYDDEAKLFKLWYKCVLADKDIIDKMMPPKTLHNVGWFCLYATSKDGIVWDKPNLGLHGFDGSKNNNAVTRDTPNVGVFKDPADPDPARRYKMVFDLDHGQVRVCFSPDGIHWSDPQIPKGLDDCGDTHNNAFYDARLRKYVLITRIMPGERLVYRSQSGDFLNWEKPTLALRSLPEEGKVRQTYCMPSFAYGSGYVGFVMMYNAGSDRLVDCELVWSPDSINWRRIFPNTQFIPRGPKNAYDSACIYAQANPPILRDGKLMIYYGGSATPHVGWKRHCLPCLARLRVDGFASYEPPEPAKTGVILTQPLLCTDQPLRISADAKGGSIRVQVLDQQGFALADCDPVTADTTDAIVKWKSSRDTSHLKGTTVRLRLELRSARLYAITGPELPKTDQ